MLPVSFTASPNTGPNAPKVAAVAPVAAAPLTRTCFTAVVTVALPPPPEEEEEEEEEAEVLAEATMTVHANTQEPARGVAGFTESPPTSDPSSRTQTHSVYASPATASVGVGTATTAAGLAADTAVAGYPFVNAAASIAAPSWSSTACTPGFTAAWWPWPE